MSDPNVLQCILAQIYHAHDAAVFHLCAETRTCDVFDASRDAAMLFVHKAHSCRRMIRSSAGTPLSGQ